MEELIPVKKKLVFRRTKKQIAKLLKEFNSAEGTSVVDFCRSQKISKANFYNWQKRFSSILPPEQKPVGFIPLQPVGAPTTATLFAEVNGIRLYQPVAPGYLKALIS